MTDWDNVGAPLELLKRQINDDYYKSGLTFRQVLHKYRRYDRKDIVKILGLYELDAEPEPERKTSMGRFPQEWERECRRLNPKAWEGR